MNRTLKKHKTHRADSQNGRSIIVTSALGSLTSVISLLVTTILMAGICLLLDDPHKIVGALCLFVLYSSAFAGGIYAAQKSKEKLLLCGTLSGAFFMIVVWIIFSILKISFQIKDVGIISSLIKLSLIPTSILGSLLGADSGRKKHKHRKKR